MSHTAGPALSVLGHPPILVENRSKRTDSPETAGPFHRNFALCAVCCWPEGEAKQVVRITRRDTSGLGLRRYLKSWFGPKLLQLASVIGIRVKPLALALECRLASSRSRRRRSNCAAPRSIQAWPWVNRRWISTARWRAIALTAAWKVGSCRRRCR